MNQAQNILFEKLNAFIKKYYKNRLIKGCIWFTAFFAVIILSISLLEYAGWYNSIVRALLFYTSLLGFLFLLGWYIVIPLSKLLRLGKTISYNQAAQIIGSHFPEINDKLLNTLQLIQQQTDMALLEAAIEQKTNQLKPIPFTNAINFKSNLKYLKYTVWPVLALLIILIVYPSLIVESSKRVIQYNTVFVKPAPFQFNIKNSSLIAEQFSDLELDVEITGSVLPNEVFIELNQNKFRLNKKHKSVHTYTIKNIQQSTNFRLLADEFYSDEYTINVLVKPVLINYTVSLQYPTYLGLKNQVLNNPTDMEIPTGTIVKWNFNTKHTDDVFLNLNGLNLKAEKQRENGFSFSRKLFTPTLYSIKPKNKQQLNADSLTYQIKVIQDQYPEIQAEQRTDSVYSKLIYLAGNASDDYGLTRLTFNYRFTNKEKANKGLKTIEIPIEKGKQTNFYHQFNLYEINAEMGDELEYFFEVWDNDGVFKPKKSKSNVFTLKAPDKQEIKKQTEAGSKQFESSMKEALKEANNLQKDLNDLQRKMQSNQPLNWEEKRKAEELLQRQKELTKKIEDLQKEFKQKNIKEQEFKEEDKRILEKQLELEKMYNEILNDEMKKILQQLEKMLQLQNKDQINKELNKLELNNKDVEKELDRMLEMYKQLEVEKKMQQAINDLKELAEKQKELAKETNNKQADNQQLKQKQDDLKKEFDEIKKDLQDAAQKNKDLENPKELPDTKEEQKSIEEQLKQSEEELNKGNNKKASEKQKKAAEEMDKMAEKMQQQMEKEEEEQNEEDAETLREILENLIQLSKDQEDLMLKFKTITGYNPQFVQLAQEQKRLKDNAKIVEDSLLALSKRNPMVKSFVNREVSKMNEHLQQSVKGFSERIMQNISTNQQYAMTSMNNLAVMLSESLKQMQSQNQSKKSGSKSSKQKGKNSGNKPSMSDLKKMQEQLNKQLREGMNKNGSGEKNQMTSEQYARMAAQQMAIRQQMQKMMQQMDALEKQKMGGGKELNELQQLMQQTEKELVNKRLTQETIMRQQEILTRLLEHEKAEKKQEEDNKREGEQAKEYPKPSPKYLEELSKKQSRQTELLKTVPAQMQPYYKEKAKQYLQQN
ncbi:MAG: DUF4175 family protein [Bacteroidia bacterium]